MAKKKSIAHKQNITRSPSRKDTTPSYDTQMIIVIILLLLAYPLGIIFMWAWMNSWPNWVKMVISLPLIIALLIIVVIFYFVGSIIRNGRYYDMKYHHRVENVQNNYQNGSTNPVSPSVFPSNY